MRTNWQTKKLGEVCDKASSNVSQNQLINENGDFPIYGASGFIKNVSFYHRDKEYVSIIKDGAGIGRVALLPPFSSIIGTLQYLIPKENIDIRYFYYFLNSIDFLKYKNGSTIPHVYFKDYAIEPILVPPIPEQRRIVAILDEAFGAITKVKENAGKNLQNTRELFESYLQNVFTNPRDGWKHCNLEDYIKFIDYRGRTPKKTGSGIRLITAKNVKSGYLQIEPLEYVHPNIYKTWMTRGIPKIGDVLFTTEAPLANVAQLDTKEKVVFSQRIIIFQPMPNKLNQTFLKYLLLSKPIQERIHTKSTGATVKGIKARWLKKIPIEFPALAKQRTIVAKLDALSTETKKLKAIYQRKLADLEELKKSILKKAFNGGL